MARGDIKTMNEKVIIVKLWGGLGNQLFQYAYAYHVAKKNECKLILDISWFKRQDLREPEILKLNVKYDDVCELWDKNKAIGFWNKSTPNRILRILPYAKYRIAKMDYLKESRGKYVAPIARFKSQKAYLDGYWQCPMYFDEIKEELKELFVPMSISDEVIALGEQLKRNNTVAVHIRRGDYPTKKIWYSRLKTIGNEYYKSAIRIMKNINPNAEYYLFSNDVAGTKGMIEEIIGEPINVLPLNKCSALDEWYLMSCCQNQIIGNSTFSWWTAYINGCENKKVIAPDGYMGNDDILPEDWIRVSLK